MTSLEKIEKLLKKEERHLQCLNIWCNQALHQMEMEGQHTSMLEDYDDLSRQISSQKEVCKNLREELSALLQK